MNLSGFLYHRFSYSSAYLCHCQTATLS